MHEDWILTLYRPLGNTELNSFTGNHRPQEVEQITLDTKVGAQELVEALAGKEALPILAELQSWSTMSSLSTGL